MTRFAIGAILALFLIGGATAFPLDHYSILVRLAADGVTVTQLDTQVKVEKYMAGGWAKVIVPVGEHVQVGKPLPAGAFESN